MEVLKCIVSCVAALQLTLRKQGIGALRALRGVGAADSDAARGQAPGSYPPFMSYSSTRSGG